MAQQQFQHDHARLDGFPKPYIIRDEKIYTRHLNGANYRIQLVTLNFNAAAKW